MLSVAAAAAACPPSTDSLSRASSLSSVLTMDNDEWCSVRLPQKDSGVCLYPGSSMESELSKAGACVVGEVRVPARRSDEAGGGRMYSGRSRRHSAVATLPVIHDDEVAHDFRRGRSGSLGDTGHPPTRRCSVYSTDSGSSMQSQLPTIVDWEVLPPQPIPACLPGVTAAAPTGPMPCRRYSAVVYPATAVAAQQISVISPRDSEIYQSLPCRSHHKALNVHSKLLCKRRGSGGGGLMCQQGDHCMSPLIISPVMQLYMESNNPVLQDYVQKVLRLNSCDPESCSVCSVQPSMSSLPSWPDCFPPAQPVHVTIDSAGDSCSSTTSHSPSAATAAADDDKKGRPLKPGVEEAVRAIRRHALRDVLFSVLRNMACYMLLVGLVLLIAQQGLSFSEMPLWKNVIPLALLAVGALGVSLQIMHSLRELRHPASRTLIAEMLATQMKSQRDFMSMINKRISNAPYVAIEIKKRHRLQGKVLGVEKDDDSGQHWSRISKRISKMLAYEHWSDLSEDIDGRAWDRNHYNWIIVVKDYRAASLNTVNSINEDVRDFCRDNLFDEAHPNGMRSRMILDVMEGEAHPDVQAYLVSPDGTASRFYAFSMYKAMLFAALDSLYNIVFHLATRHLGRYNIVKVIER